jgi:hydrogenase maturation protease
VHLGLSLIEAQPNLLTFIHKRKNTSMQNRKTTLLIGLGNPILGDDGIGWRVVEQAEALLAERSEEEREQHQIDILYLSLGGLSLMEHMEGYQDVIVVDSILTKTKPNGTIYSLPLSQLPDYSSGHSTAIHDTSLATALTVGRKMQMVLPDDVWVIAVEAEYVFDFSEELSPPVAAALPGAVEVLMDVLIKDDRMDKII